MTLAILGLVNHDLFVHRRIFGDRGSWIASIVLTLPLPFNPTGYAQTHLQHHRSIGTEHDTEVYKQDVHGRWRRLLFCTVVGLKRAMNGAWATTKRPPYLALRTDNPTLHRRVAIENRLQTLVTILMVAAAWRWPWAIIWGYFVPTLVLAPLLNTFRIIIEHAEVNPDNPYHLATFYRTSWFARLIYLWDAGDCHLIHHIYPTVPYYRIGKALDLMRPFLLAHGVIERRSYWALLWGWFVKNYPHRSLWPIAPAPRLP
jgi:fatty acid desaturase